VTNYYITFQIHIVLVIFLRKNENFIYYILHIRNMEKKIALTFGKTRKIDDKDKKILEILLKNGREPITSIAKKVKMSHDAVRYRIKKLREDGVILKYEVLINGPLIGYNIYALVLISLGGYTAKEKEDFIKFLIGLDNVYIIDELVGDFDIELQLIAKDSEEYSRITSIIREKFGNIIKDWKSFLSIKEHKYQSFISKFQ